MAIRSQTSDEAARLLVEVSRMHYEENLTQEQIGHRLRMSRPTVGRLLQEARARGVVRIAVVPPQSHEYLHDLEAGLGSAFPCLKEAVVVPGRADWDASPMRDALREALVSQLARAAAWVVDRSVRPRSVIAVPWGHTAGLIAAHLQPATMRPDLRVAPIVGALHNQLAEFEASVVARSFAEAYGARHMALMAPAVIRDSMLVPALRAHELVKEVLDAAHRADVVVLTVKPAPATQAAARQSSVVRAGVIPEECVCSAVEQSAVGEVCQWYFDESGTEVQMKGATVLGLGLDAIREMAAQPRSCVMCVAGVQPERTNALRAALAGGLMNCLVTDHVTAMALLGASSEAPANRSANSARPIARDRSRVKRVG